MGKADCPICEAQGFGSCDRCGNPTFDGGDLCDYCRPDSGHVRSSACLSDGHRRCSGRARVGGQSVACCCTCHQRRKAKRRGRA